jgi:dCTP deaminase
MILSNVEIHRALDAGLIVIEPQPQPREPGIGQVCPYQTSAVDLTLGTEISYFKPKRKAPVNIDLREGKFADLFIPYSVKTIISEEQPFVLVSGRFILARTQETVTLPLDKPTCLAARVEGKSSYSRCGLLVHFTAPTIHAGFSGVITLELINFGPLPISLYPGMPICQLIIEKVEGVPFRNDSQFQGQSQTSGAR